MSRNMYGNWIIYVLSCLKVLVVLASGPKGTVPIIKILLKSCYSPLFVHVSCYLYLYVII